MAIILRFNQEPQPTWLALKRRAEAIGELQLNWFDERVLQATINCGGGKLVTIQKPRGEVQIVGFEKQVMLELINQAEALILEEILP